MSPSGTGSPGPRVSVITATHERADLLVHTIESLRRQTFRDFEHIVIDGGSKDGTVALLRRLAGEYPVRWVSEPDDGMYQAINRGLRMASGAVLAYLNSDDLYFPWTLETVVRTFDAHGDVDVVYGDALSVEHGSGQQAPYWVLPPHADYLQRTGFLAQPSVFWRRSVMDDLGDFDESLRYVADCDYWMRAIRTHRFMKVDEFLSVERDHPGTLRLSQGSAVWKELAAVRTRYVALEGPQHVRMMRRHRLWSGVIKRWYVLRVVVQASLPGRLRRGPWSQFLSASHGSVRRTAMLLRSIPKLGPRFISEVMDPDTHWLEPAE